MDDYEHENLLTTKQAAAYLGRTEKALLNMRYNPSCAPGPKYVKIGSNRVRYRQADLDDWVGWLEARRSGLRGTRGTSHMMDRDPHA